MCRVRKSRWLVFLLTLIAVPMLAISCGKKVNAEFSIADYLPDQTASGLQQTSEIHKYNRETLWEFLDAGADLYLDNGFTRMATAEYRIRDLKFTAGIYEFDSPEAANRLYTIIRPPDVLRDIDFGQGGYLDPGMLTFVQANCLVRLIGYTDTAESQELLVDLAKAVVRQMQAQPNDTSE